MEEFIGLFASIWVVLVFVVGIFAAKKSQEYKRTQKSAVNYDAKKQQELREKREAERKKREEFARFSNKTTSTLSGVSTLKSSFHDGHYHGSGEDEVEQREDIVGSLGANYDEGCPALVNTRLLTKTADESGKIKEGFDYDQIAAAIVFGSVLSQPKWKE